MSDSNSPYYQTGDIVILDKQLDFQNYKIGDAILYSPPNFGATVIHRIYDIKIINGTYYFAVRGAFNPQPDVRPEVSNITNRILENVTINWSGIYGTNNATNPTAKYIVVSYFPANEFIFGRVIQRIPVVGWVLVPFNSPNVASFLPFSLFSILAFYYIILIIAVIVLLLYNANLELKNLLYNLSHKPLYNWKPSKIYITNFFTFVFYPLLFFILIFASISAVPNVFTDQIVLQSFDQPDFNTTNLTYQQLTTFRNIEIYQNNKTTIQLTIHNQSNILVVNITKNSTFIGLNPETHAFFNLTMNDSYQLTVDAKSMVVMSSSKKNVPELGLFFEYMVSITSKQPVGLMTQNTFLKATSATYNNTPAYQTGLNLSYVEYGMNIQINEKVFFDPQGYLLFLTASQTSSIWGIPEMLGLLIIASFTIIIYYVIQHDFQMKLNERQEKILKAQLNSSAEIVDLSDQTDEFSTSSNKVVEPQNDISESKKENLEKKDQNEENDVIKNKNSKNKLSWEEYKKLEDGE